MLRCGKGTTFEGGLRVPAIFHWPGHIDPTAVSDELATTLDLLPTFLALSEHAVALQPDRQQQALPKFDGIDLSGLLLRNEASPRTTVIYYPQLAQQSRGVYGESVARRSLQLGLVVCIVCAHGRKTESFGRMVWCFVHTAVRVGSVKVHFKQQGSMQLQLLMLERMFAGMAVWPATLARVTAKSTMQVAAAAMARSFPLDLSRTTAAGSVDVYTGWLGGIKLSNTHRMARVSPKCNLFYFHLPGPTDS
eukprot:COSAG02_NODE_2109_length_9808_cov_4.669379_1_plen_248_part_10